MKYSTSTHQHDSSGKLSFSRRISLSSAASSVETFGEEYAISLTIVMCCLPSSNCQCHTRNGLSLQRRTRCATIDCSPSSFLLSNMRGKGFSPSLLLNHATSNHQHDSSGKPSSQRRIVLPSTASWVERTFCEEYAKSFSEVAIAMRWLPSWNCHCQTRNGLSSQRRTRCVTRDSSLSPLSSSRVRGERTSRLSIVSEQCCCCCRRCVYVIQKCNTIVWVSL